MNKINTKIKCLFRHITLDCSSCKTHIISYFHKLLSWKQFFPRQCTCFRTICLWGDDLFTDFHILLFYSQCLQVIPGTTLTPIFKSSFSLLLQLLQLHMQTQELLPSQLLLCQTNWTALICSCQVNLQSCNNLGRLCTFSRLVSTLL